MEEIKNNNNEQNIEEDLKKDLKECKIKSEEYLNGWKRAKADYLNLKKESEENLKNMVKFGNRVLLAEILPVIDNFEIALKNTPENLKNDKWRVGILNIYNNFINILKSQGLEKIETVGKIFDPALHEAIEEEESELEDLTVLEEFQSGWKLYDAVLRPARVRVAKNKIL